MSEFAEIESSTGRKGLVRKIGIGLLTLAAAAAGLASVSVVAHAQTGERYVRQAQNVETIILHKGKTQVIDLPVAAGDVVVSNPAIVDTVMRTARQPMLFGLEIGQANAIFFDTAGRQIVTFEIRVEYDTELLSRMIEQHFPSANVKAESILGEIILTGQATSSIEAASIGGLAARFVAASKGAAGGAGGGEGGGGLFSGGGGEEGAGGGEEASSGSDEDGVVNRINVINEEQVLLKVQVSEVNRTVLKRLGIDWNAGLQATTLDSTIGFSGKTLDGFLKNYSITNLETQVLGLDGEPLDVPADFDGDGVQDVIFNENRPLTVTQTLDTFLKVLEQHALVATLAEPSLTAISGESASFLAGGEFPIPISREDEGISIDFKQFGISLDFTPVVIGEGRISLTVATEVSELSETGAIVVNGLSIPALALRRANTTLELSSGGTIMMAGMIEQSTRRLSNGLPGLRQLPILGQLFRSEEFAREETELVILVTPYTVQQGAKDDFVLPTDGFAPASDIDMYVFGRLHSVYGADPAETGETAPALKAPVGFIME